MIPLGAGEASGAAASCSPRVEQQQVARVEALINIVQLLLTSNPRCMFRKSRRATAHSHETLETLHLAYLAAGLAGMGFTSEQTERI